MQNIIWVLSFIVIQCFHFSANAQTLQWAKSMGGANGDRGSAMTFGLSGQVLTCGEFQGLVDFDPGAGVSNLNSANGKAYIQALDNAGNFIWAVQFAGAGAYALSIKTDLSGNIYCGGSFTGTGDFDPGPGVFNITSVFGVNTFLLKLDSTGNFIWAKQFTSVSNATNVSESIALDNNGNVYSTGSFYDTTDFDPGVGIYSLSPAGNWDVFVSKLDVNGNFVWAKKVGSTGADQAYAITTDNFGNVIVSGVFSLSPDFDPGPGIFNLSSSGNTDIFNLKLDTAGNFVWAKKMGGSSADISRAVTTDLTGDILSCGHFQGTGDFDPGVAINNLTSAGSNDIFISKLNGNGDFQWAKRIGSTGNDLGYAITTDQWGNVYVGGGFSGTVDFDPGGGIYNLSSSGGSDIYILKLNHNGDFQWVISMGGTSNDESCFSVLADQNNNIYSTGGFYTTADFDPGPGVYNLISAGSFDAFVHKYQFCSTSYTTNYTACDSISINGITYTTSGSYTQVLNNGAGCDSILTMNITINHPTASSISQIACDSIVVNGQTFTSSGTYTQTLINVGGCDSILTLNLTVNYSNTDTILQQAYGSYTLNGQTYFASGVYTQVFTNIVGCDSIIILNLTIESNNPCNPDLVINSSPYFNYLTESQTWIVTSGTVLVPLGTYAKFDAAANSYVTLNPGFKAEHGSVFIAQAYNGCTAGSPQLPKEKIFNSDPFVIDEIVLYPNPTTGLIHIQHNEKLDNIMVFDMVGKLLINQTCEGETETNIDLSNLPNGVYHVKVAGYNSIKVTKNN